MGGNITNPFLSTNLQSLSGTQFLGRVIGLLITLGFIVGTVAFLFMLLTGGLAIITSQGDKAKVEQARQQLSTAVIGLVILFAAFAVLNLIEILFNIDLLQITIPTLESIGS